MQRAISINKLYITGTETDFRTLVADNLLHQVYSVFKANFLQANNSSRR